MKITVKESGKGYFTVQSYLTAFYDKSLRFYNE